MRARPIRPTLVLLLALLAAACSQAGATPTPPATPSPAIPPSPSASPPTAGFPVTLTDYSGTDVEIPAEPETIVSLTPAATEILFAIEAGYRVVGKVEDIANHPPEAADVPVVATFAGVDIEKIVALEPDLVIAGGNGGTPEDAIERLRALDLPVLVVYAADIEDVFTDMEQIGVAAGEAERSRDLADAMRAQFDAVDAATRELDRPRVFYETGDQPAIYGVADDSFVASMLELAGADPITTGSSTVWEMSQERLVAEDPEIILLGDAAYGVSPEGVAARPGWAEMTAVEANAIRPIDDIVVTRPGPRLVQGLHGLVAAIHPEVEISGASSPPSSASPAASGG